MRALIESYKDKDLFDKLPVSIIITSEAGEIIRANTTACKMFGYDSKEEFLKLRVSDLYCNIDDRKEIIERIKTGKKLKEVCVRRKDNSTFWVQATSLAQTAESGEVHFINVVEDVTALKQKEEIENKLRKNEASLSNAQRIAKIGNWEWNIEKNELFWSDEIYRIFGLTPQVFGATYEAFLNSVHPDDREYVKEAVNKALYKNIPYSIDHRIVLPDGTVRVVHEQAEVVFDDTGKAIQMNGTVQDITERKQIEDKFRKLSHAVE